ncbi:hypothetical protein P8C59_007856 [Phyllachora maydis]|uniref:Cytochrome c oxidase assembly factor 3 n=1 Tax=Phyllachora maydis TaxID=1825666 RepID=A0AAD9I999_9PEZI|nr:hypothetical protein P8C59_007856 [Phyllachora maydis]
MAGSGYSHKSYYDRHMRQSPSLIRARRPYLVKNALIGVGLFALTGGIYAMTLRKIGQDDFEDVKVPDVPVKKGQEAAQQGTR